MSALGKIDSRYRTILGLYGLGNVTDDQLEETASKVCPGPSVEESVQCLLDSLSQINCPEGFRKKFLEVFCQFPLENQKTLIDRKSRPVDMTHYTRIALTAGTNNWTVIDENLQVALGISSFEKGKIPNPKDIFVLCAIQMQAGIGTGGTPAATNAIYGRIANQNIVPAAGAINYSYIDFPPEVMNGEILFEIGDRKIWQKEPLIRFRTYSYEKNLIGYSAFDSQHLITGNDIIRMKISSASSFTPPAGSTYFLETAFHGVGIMPA